MVSYIIDGVNKSLSDVPPEQRALVGSALITLGYNKQTHEMDPASLTDVVAAKIIEKALQNSMNEIPFGPNRKIT